jgi:hypothetical protein
VPVGQYTELGCSMTKRVTLVLGRSRAVTLKWAPFRYTSLRTNDSSRTSKLASVSVTYVYVLCVVYVCLLVVCVVYVCYLVLFTCVRYVRT